MFLKEKIIELLHGSRPLTVGHISGLLGISDTEVKELAGEIINMGYQLELTDNEYLLKYEGDLLLPGLIRKSLDTEIFGKGKIYYYLETDSTSLRAEELADKGAPEGTIVVAEKQTHGRGRSGRSWFSDSSEGIYLSMILRPVLAPARVQGVTIVTAVAAYEALMNICSLPMSIKWPNDILIDGKKAVGILTTMKSSESEINPIIVGIGINVNTDISTMPDEIKNTATSLYNETGIKIPRLKVITSFLESFEKRYYKFVSNKFQEIVNDWIKYSGLSGKFVEISMINHNIEGTVKGIDNNGYLLVNDINGVQQKIISGEITKIK